MINLIPPKAKKSILIEYWVRVLSVWFTTWSIALIAGVGIFLPAYVLIGSQVSVYEKSAAEASQKVADYDTVANSLELANQQARIVMDESTGSIFSDYIKLFESLQGTGIQTSEIQISRDEAGISPIELVGVAENRQALASFRDRLLAEDQVEVVDFPISNLASDKDIQFTITVTLSNNDSV